MLDPPMCRATVRDGRITLNSWSPRQWQGSGARPAALGSVSAAVLDLHPDGDELVVEHVAGPAPDDRDREALATWAGATGYRRLWLPDDLIELGDVLVVGHAAVTCPTCGARWEDGTTDFWLHVRAGGCFPGFCRVCGGSLPEWDVTVSDQDGPERLRSCGETRR
jgi:hypothetical protein